MARVRLSCKLCKGEHFYGPKDQRIAQLAAHLTTHNFDTYTARRMAEDQEKEKKGKE